MVSTEVIMDAISVVSFILIVLNSWLCVIVIFSVIKLRYQNYLIRVLFCLWITITFVFLVDSLSWFYFFFERRLIFIFIIVLLWGYQPERLSATIYICFYTLTASIPLLVTILIRNNLIFRSEMIIIYYSFSNSTPFYSLIVLLGFFAKLPIFGLHLWLPKAHVEAPVIGSIILAGVLLKLGGYGMILFKVFNCSADLIKVFSIWGLIGGVIIRVTILRTADLKVMIAYSSVVHISILIPSFLLGGELGWEGGVWIIIGHGLASSGLFRGANIIYVRSHTRRMFLNKGVLRVSPRIALFWLLLIVLNFRGPFTINLIREISMATNLAAISLVNLFLVSMICFFSLVYNLILYRNSIHGVRSIKFYFYSKINSCELLILCLQIWPAFLAILMI